MKQYVFSVKEGATGVSQKTAETLGPLLVMLAEKGVKSVPRELVKLAQPKSHPAHKYFEWDDVIAGAQHRLQQARLYQQRIVYEVIVRSSSKANLKTTMRCVYPIKGLNGETRYISGSAMTRDVDAMAQLIERALCQIVVWKNTYSHLRGVSELTGIFDAVEKVLAKKNLKLVK